MRVANRGIDLAAVCQRVLIEHPGVVDETRGEHQPPFFVDQWKAPCAQCRIVAVITEPELLLAAQRADRG